LLDHRRHIPQLDGLRGVAILLVLFHHTGMDAQFALSWRPSTHGWVGVDLFFVLSGFLITGILLDTKGSSTYFTSFYLRRGLRIWPLYYIVLFLALVVVPFFSEGVRSLITGTPRWPYWLYLQNFVIHGYGKEGLGPTWSLCIEEQFYLVWPLAIFFLTRFRVKALLLLVLCVSPLIRHFIFTSTGDWQIVYRNTFSHLDALAAGALVAILLREPGRNEHTTALWMLRLAALAALVGLPILIMNDRDSTFVFTFLALGFGGLLGATVLLPEGSAWNRFLTIRFLRYCGKISYGLYLTNLFTYHMAQWIMRRSGVQRSFLSEVLFAVAANMVLFLITAASWRFFEEPILSLKRKFSYAEPSRQKVAAATA